MKTKFRWAEILFLVTAFWVSSFLAVPGWAYDETEGTGSPKSSGSTTSTAQPQTVGGLNFDVDEGVEIEQGPGGSVYLKSNRESMQRKFQEIENRLATLEDKFEKLEAAIGNDSETPVVEKKENNGRVLVN